jgi:hypothetical protein
MDSPEGQDRPIDMEPPAGGLDLGACGLSPSEHLTPNGEPDVMLASARLGEPAWTNSHPGGAWAHCRIGHFWG